jgi:pectate lyase
MQVLAGIIAMATMLPLAACAVEGQARNQDEASGMNSAASATPQLISAGGGLINAGGGVCLGIKGSSTLAGADAVVGECAGTLTQTWHVHNHTTVGGELGWQLENGENKCLTVLGESTSGGAQVIQDDCSATSNHAQIWRPETDAGGVLRGFTSSPGEGQYWLRNGHSGLCLGLKGSSTSGGTPAVQGRCNLQSLTQQWDFAG